MASFPEKFLGQNWTLMGSKGANERSNCVEKTSSLDVPFVQPCRVFVEAFFRDGIGTPWAIGWGLGNVVGEVT
jgi:hypothetical protein